MPDSADVRIQEEINRQWTYQNNGEGSLGELLTGLTTDLSTLLRQEVQLAKVETMENVTHATQSVVLMAVGGFVAYAGFLTLLVALVTGLATLFSWPIWLSALIIGVIVLIIGVVVLQSGRGQLNEVNVVPEKTVETIKENVDMIKEKTS